MTISPEIIENMFTSGGSYRFARWGRPISPVIFGTNDATLDALKDAFVMTASLADMRLADTDPEFGSNFMMFFCKNWDEVSEIPDIDKLLPNVKTVIGDLKSNKANQYRRFAFDENGAIKFCIVLIQLDKQMASSSVQSIGTVQMMRSLLTWSENAFDKIAPVGVLPENNMTVVVPSVAAVIRAAYDGTMPVASDDTSHALRLYARANQLLQNL